MRIISFIFLVAVASAAHAADATGRLLDETGKPLASTTVCLCTRNLDIYDAKLPCVKATPQQVADWPAGQSDMWLASTDAEGRFSFAAPEKKFMLIAANDRGYVIQTSKQVSVPATLQLTRWARIHGVVKRGSEPAGADIPVFVGYDTPPLAENEVGPYLHFDIAKTDAHGEFTIERAFAGDYVFDRMASRTMRLGTKLMKTMTPSGMPAHATVNPGESAQALITITGRPVTGRIALPDKLRDRQDLYLPGTELNFDIQLPSIKLPADVLKLSSEQRQSWLDAWKQSEDGQRALQQFERLHRRRTVEVSVDGTFELLDMEPGTYTIPQFFYARGAAPGSFDVEHHLASVSYRFTVPPIPGGVSDTPLDVGTLDAQPQGVSNLGQPAPDFVFQTLDGAQHTLGQFKGKVILLDFWGTWCGSCVAQLPHLKEIHDTVGNDPNFVMISLSSNDTPQKLRPFVEQHDMTWPQAVLGDDKQAAPLIFYGVGGFPTYWLIDRNGKTIYSDWRSDDLKAAVQKALQQ
jgi:thiol-disulfide isomerase/thioredoxin